MQQLTFVCCVNRPEVARRCVLTSPCLAPQRGHQLVLASGMGSAAEGFAWGARLARHEWMVMLHQDVYLPEGWDVVFAASLAAAVAKWPMLAVAGVYGVRADGVHAGHVFDRDRWLGELPVPAQAVRSLDELLLAVRLDTGLAPDRGLGWHLYGTDLCLRAQSEGWGAAVIEAPCEHRASLLRDVGAATAAQREALAPVVAAFNASARRLAELWPQAMPVVTPVAALDTGFELTLPQPAP